MSIKNINCNNYNSFLQHLIIHARFLTYNNLSIFIKPTTLFNNGEETYIITYKNFQLITTPYTYNVLYNNTNIMYKVSINGYKYIKVKFLIENITRLSNNVKNYTTDVHPTDENHLITLKEIFEIPETMPNINYDFKILQSFLIKTINNFEKCHINIGLNVNSVLFFKLNFILLYKPNIIPVYNILNTPLENCPITLEPAEETAQLKICGHLFSVIGLTNWLKEKNSCPLCRAEIPTI